MILTVIDQDLVKKICILGTLKPVACQAGYSIISTTATIDNLRAQILDRRREASSNLCFLFVSFLGPPSLSFFFLSSSPSSSSSPPPPCSSYIDINSCTFQVGILSNCWKRQRLSAFPHNRHRPPAGGPDPSPPGPTAARQHRRSSSRTTFTRHFHPGGRPRVVGRSVAPGETQRGRTGYHGRHLPPPALYPKSWLKPLHPRAMLTY